VRIQGKFIAAASWPRDTFPHAVEPCGLTMEEWVQSKRGMRETTTVLVAEM
jgi:hypothetical protein